MHEDKIFDAILDENPSKLKESIYGVLFSKIQERIDNERRSKADELFTGIWEDEEVVEEEVVSEEEEELEEGPIDKMVSGYRDKKATRAARYMAKHRARKRRKSMQDDVQIEEETIDEDLGRDMALGGVAGTMIKPGIGTAIGSVAGGAIGAADRALKKRKAKKAATKKEEVDVQEADSKEDFKPHMMYDPKSGEGHKADTYEDHLRMKKMGYTHEKPETKEEGYGYGKKMKKEDLKGGQKKLDKNKNNKIDADDFAMMRKG